jgi:hypothetical protein
MLSKTLWIDSFLRYLFETEKKHLHGKCAKRRLNPLLQERSVCLTSLLSRMVLHCNAPLASGLYIGSSGLSDAQPAQSPHDVS